MNRAPFLGSLCAVAALCALGAAASAHQPRAAGIASNWEIGPVIGTRNYSEGVPLSPTADGQGGWYFDLPPRPGSVHYVTFRHGPLTGKRRLVMRYRVDAAPGVELRPITDPASPYSIVTLYFQRAGDTWSGRGPYESYRWYATFASKMPVLPGEHTISAPLDGRWTAVMTSSARTNPRGFAEAKARTDRIGFVLGGGDGFGHGVFATGRARFTVLDFRVE